MNEEDEAFNEIERRSVAKKEVVRAALESQKPVIDKSAAIRIATSLGWSPPRTWVGLTDEEIKRIEETTTCLENESWLRNLTRNLEAKLKERNT